MPTFEILVRRSVQDQSGVSTFEETVRFEADSAQEASQNVLTEIRKFVSQGTLEVVSVVETPEELAA